EVDISPSACLVLEYAYVLWALPVLAAMALVVLGRALSSGAPWATRAVSVLPNLAGLGVILALVTALANPVLSCPLWWIVAGLFRGVTAVHVLFGVAGSGVFVWRACRGAPAPAPSRPRGPRAAIQRRRATSTRSLAAAGS